MMPPCWHGTGRRKQSDHCVRMWEHLSPQSFHRHDFTTAPSTKPPASNNVYAAIIRLAQLCGSESSVSSYRVETFPIEWKSGLRNGVFWHFHPELLREAFAGLHRDKEGRLRHCGAQSWAGTISGLCGLFMVGKLWPNSPHWYPAAWELQSSRPRETGQTLLTSSPALLICQCRRPPATTITHTCKHTHRVFKLTGFHIMLHWIILAQGF